MVYLNASLFNILTKYSLIVIIFTNKFSQINRKMVRELSRQVHKKTHNNL